MKFTEEELDKITVSSLQNTYWKDLAVKVIATLRAAKDSDSKYIKRLEAMNTALLGHLNITREELE